MNHRLSITVRVDPDHSTIQFAVRGCLTEDSHPTLLSLIRRARTLTPSGRISVDLTGTRHIEAAGLHRLRAAIAHDETDRLSQPVLLVVPELLPLCSPSSAVAAARAR